MEQDFKKFQKSLEGGSKEIKKNWDGFVEQSQQTMNQWQQDWENRHQQNVEKMKFQTNTMKKKMKKNNERAREHFKAQQAAFQNKLDEIKGKIEQNIEEDKQFNEDVKKAMTQNWKTFLNGQKEVHKSFMGMQSRLWWKGYLNFLAAMLVVIGVVIAIIEILKYFDVLQ